MRITLKVNNEEYEIESSPKERLLDILRDKLGLLSVKEGCGKGECGACTVIMNGARVNSCLVPALQLDGSNIITVEGLKDSEISKRIESTYIEHGAVQCGFCMSGFVISTVGLLSEIDAPAQYDDVKKNISGNICRCTGYSKIIDAVFELNKDPDLIKSVHEFIQPVK